MSTGEGQDPRDGQSRRDGNDRRGERIGVVGGDDSVSRIQLAARWAEAYGSEGDSLAGVLRRFRAAYDYLDAVIHGVEPPELDSEVTSARPAAAAALSTSTASTPTTTASSNPSPTEPAPPPPPWSRPPEV
jgi:hypothetical protein